jgi:hypothetical protein
MSLKTMMMSSSNDGDKIQAVGAITSSINRIDIISLRMISNTGRLMQSITLPFTPASKIFAIPIFLQNGTYLIIEVIDTSNSANSGFYVYKYTKLYTYVYQSFLNVTTIPTSVSNHSKISETQFLCVLGEETGLFTLNTTYNSLSVTTSAIDESNIVGFAGGMSTQLHSMPVETLANNLDDRITRVRFNDNTLSSGVSYTDLKHTYISVCTPLYTSSSNTLYNAGDYYVYYALDIYDNTVRQLYYPVYSGSNTPDTPLYTSNGITPSGLTHLEFPNDCFRAICANPNGNSVYCLGWDPYSLCYMIDIIDVTNIGTLGESGYRSELPITKRYSELYPHIECISGISLTEPYGTGPVQSIRTLFAYACGSSCGFIHLPTFHDSDFSYGYHLSILDNTIKDTYEIYGAAVALLPTLS